MKFKIRNSTITFSKEPASKNQQEQLDSLRKLEKLEKK